MRPRNTVTIDNGTLIVVPTGLDKVWGFRKRITVPLSRITDVSVEASPSRIFPGWRGPGLDVFGKLVGTFHPRGERHYWNYSGTGAALTIGLDGAGHFHRLYLSVGDAVTCRALIEQALPPQPAT